MSRASLHFVNSACCASAAAAEDARVVVVVRGRPCGESID